MCPAAAGDRDARSVALNKRKKKPRICGAFRFRVDDSSSYLAAPAKSGNVAVVAQPLSLSPASPDLTSRSHLKMGKWIRSEGCAFLVACHSIPLPSRCHPRFSAIFATLHLEVLRVAGPTRASHMPEFSAVFLEQELKSLRSANATIISGSAQQAL